MNKIIIDKAGLLTTIQDKGRWGFQQYGISVAGAMDHFAMTLANLLLGNDSNKALLECTYSGPEISFYCDEIISITGADMSPKINGKAVAMWTSLLVKAGDKLQLSGASSGLRSYIAFSRELLVPALMGSKSTFMRARLGGLGGNKLSKGDEIRLGEKEASSQGTYLPPKYIPSYNKDACLRVVMGPQDDYFTKEAISTFLTSSYQISPEADRMGYRLEGPRINHKDQVDIISDGIVFGSIQVPGSGAPIIMMSDRQTTGGYPKIATLITPDLSVLAQMGPGMRVNFKKVSLDEAHNLYKEHINKLAEIKEALDKRHFHLGKTKNYILSLKGKSYKVQVDEIL